ncbi:hypothetical protein RHMOL_Rhmol13G0234700 [Rhododendron molle]|uniref:Uncharacterized protein n=1 Tax=Rhododendron molle TaxID=49168 RepID=A0ACC0L9Q2_RHOML|nr:hypothetical protein RHMOL_Rhmol13G0234700 [Rhododendron molle]
MCLARDRDGANPLHVAAMRGKFLKELWEKYFKSDEFINVKDDAENTILHLAVAYLRSEIIGLVLKHKKIDVNARNVSKQTVTDIQILREEQAVLTKPEGANCDIEALLHKSSAKRNMEAIDPQWLREKRTALIIVAVLIATIAFEAGVTPPGGVWPDDSVEHKAGEAVMASNYPNLYRYFLRSNTIGFVTSLIEHNPAAHQRTAAHGQALRVGAGRDHVRDVHVHGVHVRVFHYRDHAVLEKESAQSHRCGRGCCLVQRDSNCSPIDRDSLHNKHCMFQKS